MSGLLTRGRAGATIGDAMVVLSVLVMGMSFLVPLFRELSREQRLVQAAVKVDSLRASATEYVGEHGRWPAPGAPAQNPTGLSDAPSPTGEGFALEWLRWEVLEPGEPMVVEDPAVLPENDPSAADTLALPVSPPTVRAVAGIAVHSADTLLLTGLLERFGAGTSFVRDTIWTLVIPTRAETGGTP